MLPGRSRVVGGGSIPGHTVPQLLEEKKQENKILGILRSMEQVISQQNVTEKGQREKKEGKKKRFEYRDAEGGAVCTAEIVYSKELLPIPGGEKGEMGREVLSYRISKERNGVRTEIDLFSLTGIDKIGYRVFVCDGYMMNEHRQHEKVIIAEIESPVGVATFLHEAGHAAQFQDPKFDGIKDRYALPKYAFDKGIESIRHETIQGIAKRFGVDQQPAIKNALAEYEACSKKFLDLQVAKYRIEQRLLEVKNKVFDPIQKVQQMRALEEELIGTSSLIQKNNEKSKSVLKELKDVVYLPQRTLERDATRRALEWMVRLLEKVGINLFVDVNVPTSALEDKEIEWYAAQQDATEPSCDGAVKGLFKRIGKYIHRTVNGVRINAKQRLMGYGLSSYGAQDEQMEKAHGFIPELVDEYQESVSDVSNHKMAA